MNVKQVASFNGKDFQSFIACYRLYIDNKKYGKIYFL